MSEHKDRKGLFNLLKSSNMGRTKPPSSSNSNTPVAKPPARTLLSNKIHDQRNFERKEQRDKLISQNRARTNSVLSSTGTRTKPSQPPNPNFHKNQILDVIKTRPVAKTATFRPTSSNISSKTKSNDSLSTTYSIDQSQTGANLSRSSTISSANRKKLLEEWRLKKQEEEKSKPKKPAFKAGASAQTSCKSSVPTSSTFDFALSVSGSGMSKPVSSAAKKTLPPSSVRTASSRPPLRSQSVRQTNSKEATKVSATKPKCKQTPINTTKPSSHKNTEPGKILCKPANFATELETITNKMNSSISLNGPKMDTLNETHLGAHPNHTSSPIKSKFSEEYFDLVEVDKRDVKYYRDLVRFSTDKLTNLAAQWTKENEAPEEFQGDVRSACGLAKLLIDERFSQFSELINQCEETMNVQTGLVVKCSDLQGFWDMVDVQIKDVGGKFAFLEKLKSNGYVKTADMVDIQPESVAPKEREENQEGSTGEQVVVEKKPKARTNKLAEFKAKMKAMKAQSAEIEIQIAEKSDVPKEEVAEEAREVQEPDQKSRRSVRKSLVVNDVVVEKKYNLRSRPSDLIKFDSPVMNNFGHGAEESDVLTSSVNFQSPVVAEKKSKKKSIYPVISEEGDDKENDDFFSLDDCPKVTWKTRPSIYPNAPTTPARQTPKRVSAIRESFAVASSPLLKLSFITAQSKRLSINSLNRIFDKLE
ncbi:disks large-associated 5 isoform X2 [Brachionus plicatilis]|uniref:Disks large-associated 5 isoform X2 n=1 Tax=Brachionus plicatilis TaxID=10195 RepID=A0A3M7SKT9_BRAPC|nr:disks large-associated 5 isoform X2 [Brachionus plicatilis]